MMIQSAIELYGGGLGSGRHPYGRKLPAELYKGVLLKHGQEALKKGIVPQSSWDEKKTPRVYTTTKKDRAWGYAQGNLEMENDNRHDVHLKPLHEYAVIVLKDVDGKLAKQLHPQSSEDEHVFRGAVHRRYIDRVEVYRTTSNPDKPILVRTIRVK